VLGRTLLIIVTLIFCASCGTGDVDPAYEALVQTDHEFPSTGELGAGDKFELRVHGQDDLSGEFTVSPDGTINYPYIGRIEVSGKTCAEIETEIGDGLQAGYLKNPSVLCAITEYNSKRIYLFGEVKSPGAFPYKSNISIIEAVALAGGFSERANTNGTKLSRVVNGTEIQVRVPMQEIVEGRSRNIRLLPGDIIYVPESPY
jgi:polysaccharide export outer membrane protein